MTPADGAPVDELLVMLRGLPPLGEWINDASCAELGGRAGDVWTAEVVDDDELAAAAEVCRRCPVRQECADYAVRARVWGFWAGVWHGHRRRPRLAAA